MQCFCFLETSHHLLPIFLRIQKMLKNIFWNVELAGQPGREEEAMPYRPEHKDATTQRILESARQVFNMKGFSEATIAEIMSGAGLSHGGFYRHFSSKSELYGEAIRQFLCQEKPERWQAKQAECADAKIKTTARRVIDAYFSRDHFDEHETCCPLIGLPSAASRGRGQIKKAYQEVVEKLLEIFEAELDPPGKRERALVLTALCVGGMVPARGVDASSFADQIRAASHQHALKTTGWIEAGRTAKRS